MNGAYMSQYGPCQKCGLYTSVGPYEPIICSGCEENDEPYQPENSLRNHIRKNQLDDSDVEGIEVKHVNCGVGTVNTKVGMEVTVQFDSRRELVNVASDSLEVI